MKRLRTRDHRQEDIGRWACAAFGPEQALSMPQRGLRLLEEAIELFQACNGDLAMAHKLVDHVFSRPQGAVSQEMGGVGVTLLALGAAIGISADQAEYDEYLRVTSKPLEHFRRRNQEKNDAGFLAVKS